MPYKKFKRKWDGAWHETVRNKIEAYGPIVLLLPHMCVVVCLSWCMVESGWNESWSELYLLSIVFTSCLVISPEGPEASSKSNTQVTPALQVQGCHNCTDEQDSDSDPSEYRYPLPEDRQWCCPSRQVATPWVIFKLPYHSFCTTFSSTQTQDLFSLIVLKNSVHVAESHLL